MKKNKSILIDTDFADYTIIYYVKQSSFNISSLKQIGKKAFFLIAFLIAFLSADSQELSIQTGHSATITDLKFTPNNKYLVSCGADNKVIIWDMTSFMQMKLLIGHTAPVNSIAIHPEKNVFASASDDGKILVWKYPDGDLLKTFNLEKPIKAIAFSPDGKNLAVASDYAYIVDFESGDQSRLNFKAKKIFTAIEYSADGRYLGIGGKNEAKVYIYELSYGNIVNEFRAQAHSVDFNKDGSNIFSAGDNGVLKMLSTGTNEKDKYSLWANNFWDTFFDVETTEKYFISANRNKLIYVYDVETGDRVSILNAHEKEPRAISVTSDGKYLASGGKDRKIIIWNLQKFSVTKIIEGGANSISSLAFSDDGDYMFLTYGDGSNRIWNLANKGQILTNKPPKINFVNEAVFQEYSSENSFFTINPSKIFFINNLDKIDRNTEKVDNTRQKLFVWDIQNYGKMHVFKNNKKNIYKKYFIADTNNIVEVNYNATHLQEKSFWNNEKILDRQKVFSADVIVYSVNKKIKRKKKIDIEDLREKAEFEIIGDIYFTNISPNGEFMLDFKNMEHGRICDLWDLTIPEKISTVHLEKEYDFGGFNEYGTSFYVADNESSTIKIYDVSTQKLIDSVSGKTPFVFSKSEKTCAFTDSLQNLYLYDFKNKNVIFKIPTGHQTEIADIKFNPKHNYIATVAFDGLIKFWSIENGESLISLAAFDKSDFIYVTSENYYYSTKGAMQYISFLLDNTLYTFDQFDIKFNRPDTVLSKLDYTSKDEIKIYKKAYKKRVAKMGFSNYIFDETYNIPQIEITNQAEIPISTEFDEVNVEISATDSLYKLNRINIWVNSVPIFGVNGKNIATYNKNSFNGCFEVQLSSGKNKIDVTAINEQGAESLKKSFSIICEREVEPELYIVSIGISDYKDTTLNLDYAEKDATDVIKLFSKKNKSFEKVNTFKILNEEATRENILAVKDILMKTKVDDQVILFFAGHGLLDDNYDYYLTTHDFDYFDFFNTLVSYDEFTGLMDSIPARRKIIFIDACHSGEIDLEGEQENVTGAVNVNEDYESHGERSLWSQQFGDVPKFGSQNSFELMKMMFADLRRGTGTTIISSAGGQEYAYESKKIQNGVFTYVLISGVKSKKADLNKDGVIMLSELQDYVMKTVSELTKGRQNPTNRRENLDYDFIIWE